MINIRIFQIDCKVFLLKNIELNDLLYEVSSFVDECLSNNEKMLKFHLAYEYKNYVISGFKEIERDKFYKEGKVYTFAIRCIQEELMEFLLKNLPNSQTNFMKGLVSSVKVIPKLMLEKIYTITPALIKLNKLGYWRGVLSLEEYEKRLFDNAIKKYKYITGKEIDKNFCLYNRIEFLNHKPIVNNYKNIRLLTDKIELDISTDAIAQEVAYMLLGTGLMENNGRGYGYLNFRILI